MEYTEALHEWTERLRQIHLPRWQELPTLSLYMDQVLVYINDNLSFLNIEPVVEMEHEKRKEEKILTASMINNYVKQRLIPKPEKKRYHREQLACLIVYVLLKQVLPLTDIQKGIRIQLEVCGGDFEKAYDIFCRQLEVSFACVSHMTFGQFIGEETYSQMARSNLGTSMAALSLATKLYAQKVLSLNH